MSGTPCFQHDAYHPDCSDCWHDDDDSPANCPVCSLLLDGDYCHQCERQTGKKGAEK